MKKAFSFLLSLLVVCAALPLAPVTAQAFDDYTQAYDVEYYAPASASFIYQIGLYYSSSSDADAISHIESAGFTPFGGDFNAGAGGKYVHAGYKTTSDPTKALTALRIWDFTAGGDDPDNPRDTKTSLVNDAMCLFYRVGSGASEWTPNVMDGDVNLNQGNSGHHLKLYITTDRNAGMPLTALDTASDKNETTAYNTLLNAGYTVATSFNAPLSYQDLNAGAGSKSDYNYLGYKAYVFTAVDSSGLRSAYAAAKERYENGGSGYSALSAPLTAAAAILTDLNDGYTSRTQAEIDDAAAALENALFFTVTVSGGSCSGSVFKEGDSVTITANTPAAGKRFKEWSGTDGLTFTSGSKTEATATFTMPAANVSLTATYENIIYTVTATSAGHGTAFATHSSGVSGNRILLQATPDKGYRLVRWEVISGNAQIVRIGNNEFVQIGTENVVVKAIFERIVYTVTLSPGEGTGEDIVFSSANQSEIPTINNAGFNEFYLDNDGSMGFRFDSSSCPAGWSAPAGKGFTYFDAGDYTTLSQESTVFTAGWVAKGSITLTSNITLDYDSIDAEGFLPITIEVSDIDFGAATFDEISSSVSLLIGSAAMTDGYGHALSFDVYTADHSAIVERLTLLHNEEGTDENTYYHLALKFDPTALANAYGTYNCAWVCNIGWSMIGAYDNNQYPKEAVISLQMAIQDQNTYSVNVTADGRGTAYASPASGTAGTEVTLTATPDEGWYFRGWQVVSGNVTLTGNKFNIPHADVEIKAVFEEIATHTHTVTVTHTNGGTAYASSASGVYGTLVTLTAVPDHGYGLKEWQVVSGGVTITKNTFTIGDDDVEIRAVFAEDSCYTLIVPELVTVTPNQIYTPVPLNVTELSMITGVNGKKPDQLRIQLFTGTLTDSDNGKMIAFTLSYNAGAQPGYPSSIYIRYPSAQSQNCYLRIPNDIWNAVSPGTYTGSLIYRVFWYYEGNSTTNVIQQGSIPVTLTIPGAPGDVDCSGDVGLSDVVLITRWLAGGWNVTLDETVADVNKDGKVDLKDVVLIRRYLAGGWNVELK